MITVVKKDDLCFACVEYLTRGKAPAVDGSHCMKLVNNMRTEYIGSGGSCNSCGTTLTFDTATCEILDDEIVWLCIDCLPKVRKNKKFLHDVQYCEACYRGVLHMKGSYCRTDNTSKNPEGDV